LTVARGLQKIDRLARRFPLGFPSGYSHELKYGAVDNVGWTTGFWAGLLWLGYQYTGDRTWRDRAEALNPSFFRRLGAGADVDTHDLGFLYALSCVAPWKLTGDAAARSVALRAADCLTTRYWTGGRVVQAWGRLDDVAERGRIIIDSTMNMPLLFWAFAETNKAVYRDVAINHLDQCRRHLVRSDGSTFHTYFVDVETGEGRYGKTHQGLSDASCWARGQAWAIYGFSLAYRYTREERFRDTAREVAAYFLNHLPPDGICYWDLVFTDGDLQERDTSAAAIAASGLLELTDHLAPDSRDRERLRCQALGILETLTSRHVSNDPEEDGILLHAVCDRPGRNGVNESCLWGDYFYMEALVRQGCAWSSFW
jgi:unsaturated chondroitin disaccharide hydrolase